MFYFIKCTCHSLLFSLTSLHIARVLEQPEVDVRGVQHGEVWGRHGSGRGAVRPMRGFTPLGSTPTTLRQSYYISGGLYFLKNVIIKYIRFYDCYFSYSLVTGLASQYHPSNGLSCFGTRLVLVLPTERVEEQKYDQCNKDSY